ncbi:MAG: signal peptidase II [Deltaproteobacteria bacterium]|nr:signal peptidase II [Deltaproteobacteria bacterium]
MANENAPIVGILPPRPWRLRPATLFVFAALVALVDLGTKAWATGALANWVHPLVWTESAGQTPASLLAQRGIDRAHAEDIDRRGALARLHRGQWPNSTDVDAAWLGRHIVVAQGTGNAAPRATRLLNRHLGKPVAEVLAEAWRVDVAQVPGLLAHAWQVADPPAALDVPLGAGEALAVLDRTIVVLPDWLSLVYAENPGAAFSFLTNAPPLVRHLLFTVIASLASIGLAWWLWKGHGGTVLASWSLAAILGGAVGNLVDRLHYGVVIDFIYMFVVLDGKVHGWPVYNVADIGITVGVVLIAGESLFRRQPAPTAPAAASPSA